MAIGMGARGHPDHGFSGTAGAGNTAGTGVEGAYGGAMIGPDSFAGIAPGIGPAGGYKGISIEAMNNMRGKQEMGAFLQGMSKKYGFDSVRNFITGYMGLVNAPVNPNMNAQEQQNAMINNAAQNFSLKEALFESPHQGFGSLHTPGYTTTRSPVTNPEQRAYGLHAIGYSPMGYAGMNQNNVGLEPSLDYSVAGQSFNTGIFGPNQAELNAINQNQPSYAEQAQNVNVAPAGFGPSQGLGYGNYGNFGDQ
jgi:hypothetical protein